MFSVAATGLEHSTKSPENSHVVNADGAEAVHATGGGVVYRAPDELRQAVQRIADDPAWRNSLASKVILGYQQRTLPQFI